MNLSTEREIEMNAENTYSQYEILAIIKQIDQENFILANAARMVYFAGFHKDEIENIKFKNAFLDGAVLSKIEPFLGKSRKAYTSQPIFLGKWPRLILMRHIMRLKKEGYQTDNDAYVFPNPEKKIQYNTKTLGRNFKKYFGKTDFDNLRKFGTQREELRLKVKYRHRHQFRNHLLQYSRHSRLTTTNQFITGKVQAAGHQRKGDSPWEIIVKMIERIPYYKKAPKKICADVIEKIINNRFEEDDIKKSLNNLLYFYKQQLNIQ